MRLLLDTSALLGVFFSPFSLGAAGRAEIADRRNEVWVSPVSAYEIDWKRHIGKLNAPVVPDWEAVLTVRGYSIAALTVSHLSNAALLPKHHRDPWDRILVAQALAENLILVTGDSKIAAYGVATLW